MEIEQKTISRKERNNKKRRRYEERLLFFVIWRQSREKNLSSYATFQVSSSLSYSLLIVFSFGKENSTRKIKHIMLYFFFSFFGWRQNQFFCYLSRFFSSCFLCVFLRKAKQKSDWKLRLMQYLIGLSDVQQETFQRPKLNDFIMFFFLKMKKRKKNQFFFQ